MTSDEAVAAVEAIASMCFDELAIRGAGPKQGLAILLSVFVTAVDIVYRDGKANNEDLEHLFQTMEEAFAEIRG